jgi:hypothetical protein
MIAYYEEIYPKIIDRNACVETPNTPYRSPRDAEQEKFGQTIV